MDYLLYKVNGEGEGDTLVQFCHSEETKPRGETTLREIHYTLCIYKWRCIFFLIKTFYSGR